VATAEVSPTHSETHRVTIVLHVGGLHYASEKAVVEGVLVHRPGVLAVDANPVAQTATVTFDPEQTSVARLREWVEGCGYHCAGQSVPGHVCDPLAEAGRDEPHDLAAAERAELAASPARRPSPGGGRDLRALPPPRSNGISSARASPTRCCAQASSRGTSATVNRRDITRDDRIYVPAGDGRVALLHRGMTRGLLDAISPKTKLAAFVPRDPYAAGCLIELRGELADEAVARVPDRSA